MYSVWRENPGWFGLERAGLNQTTSTGIPVDVYWDAEHEVYWFEFASYEDWQRAEDD